MKVFSKEVITDEDDALCGYTPVYTTYPGGEVCVVGYLNEDGSMLLMKEVHLYYEELIAIADWMNAQQAVVEFPRLVPEATFNYNLGIANVRATERKD